MFCNPYLFPSKINAYFKLTKEKEKNNKSNTRLGMFIVDLSQRLVYKRFAK